MDFILNGQASGDVASKLLQCNFDVRSLRPFIGNDKRSYVTMNQNGILKAVPTQNATATLRKDDWKILDDAIVKVSKPRLKAVGDLRSAGLTFSIPNGMGKTVLETETMSDIGPASVSMDALRENANDRPVFELGNLPLPIIHKDFQFSVRQIMASRNGGSPLDTTSAELAARRVAEEAEKLLLGVSTVADQYSFGGGVLYGYTDLPCAITSETLSCPTGSNWDGETFLAEVLSMIVALYASYHYGPYMLYTAPAWDQYLDNDFKAGSDKTLRNRVKEVSSIQDVRTLDYLADYDIVLVQMTSDVVREVIGMDITTVEWDTVGGLQKNFKIMAILVPQLRCDQDDNSGIVYASCT